MVDGDLYRFLNKKFNGDLVYSNVYPNKVIGGLMLSRETIPLDLMHPLNAELEYGLLEIGVITPHLNMDWRVKVNGINVTKEFKPYIYSRLDNGFYAKFVYDITSILKTPESLRKKRANVTFKREGGEPFTVSQISILALYSSNEAKTNITYYSGALGLEPGEKSKEYLFEIDLGEEALLRTSIYMPSRATVLDIFMDNEHSLTVSNIQGMDETIYEVKKNIKSISYHHRDTGEKYTPKQVVVSNILLYNIIYVKPDLYFQEIDLPKQCSGECSGKIKIINNGESKPDKTMIVLMSLGNVLFSKKIRSPEPGETIEETIKYKLPPGEYDLVLRIIWRKLSKTWFRDERIKVVIPG